LQPAQPARRLAWWPARWPAFANADFWRLWFVGLVFFTVRWLEMLAMAVFVYRETHSAFVVAMLTMLRLLPMALFGAFAGALADRIERRTALLVVVACLFATSSTLAALAWLDRLAVWHLVAATFVNGTAWATDNPVRRILIGEVVGVERVGRAMSIDIGTNNASRVIGPTIGGVLLAGVGIEGVFSLSMALYAAAALAALLIRHRSAIRSEAAAPLLAHMAEGFAAVRSDRRIRAALVVTIVFNLFGWPFTSMIPVIGQDHLLLDPQGIGILASMDGLGAFIGATLIAVMARPASYARLYLAGTALYLVLLPLFALAGEPALAGLALVCTGITGAAFMTMQSTLIYVLAPPALRSRVFGVLSVCIGLGPLGFVQIGLLADAWGAPFAIAAIGIEGLVVLALSAPLWRILLRP
jgi:MFS family permease